MNLNKKIGNSFEQDLCELLYEKGFWVHNLAQNQSGQPADIIAVKNGKAYLIDAKVCSNDRFDLTRIEENQHSAMGLWNECGNESGWFSLRLSDGSIHMYSYDMLRHLYEIRGYRNLSKKHIGESSISFEKWVLLCS